MRATNDEGTGDWSASAIATTSDNRAPSFIDGATTTRSVHENAATGWNIGGAIGATDADGDTLTYSISGTDAASFTIDSTSGQLKTSAPLDYETDDSYSVNVVASDGQGGTDSIAVTIRVTDINEPPGQPTALLVVPGWLPLTLDVSWTAPTNTGPAITGYDVWYKKVGNSSWSAHPFTGPTTFRQITGLQAASLYEVKVRATNAEGTGIWSGIETGLTGS